jgi:hypothetical protein
MTTTSPFAEKRSVGLIGADTSMVMRLYDMKERSGFLGRDVFGRINVGHGYSDMER